MSSPYSSLFTRAKPICINGYKESNSANNPYAGWFFDLRFEI